PGGIIALTGWREHGRVLVTVEDSGPGIPPDKLKAIFERFYSERPQGEKFGTHSGLGLSISHQIVEAHGGTLTADNMLDPAGRIPPAPAGRPRRPSSPAAPRCSGGGPPPPAAPPPPPPPVGGGGWGGGAPPHPGSKSMLKCFFAEPSPTILRRHPPSSFA